MTIRGTLKRADQSSHYAIVEDVQADCLEGGVIRCDARSCKDQSAGHLSAHDTHHASGVFPTGKGQATPYALVLEGNGPLLEGVSIRLGEGSSDDLRNGLLSGPDIHQDDASGLIPTRGDPRKPYTLILDRNRRLLEWASMRLCNGGSDDLRNGLLSAPDTHQDDASGLIPTKEGQSTHYAMILEGYGRLLEGALIRLGNGGLKAPRHGLKNDYNFKTAESFSTLGANSKPLILPGEGDTRIVGEGPDEEGKERGGRRRGLCLQIHRRPCSSPNQPSNVPPPSPGIQTSRLVVVLFQNHMPSEAIQQQQLLPSKTSKLVGTALKATSTEMGTLRWGLVIEFISTRLLGTDVMEIPPRRQTRLPMLLRSYRRTHPKILLRASTDSERASFSMRIEYLSTADVA